MDVLYLTLEKVRNKPEMFIGTKCLTRLKMFIQGYLYRQYEIDDNYKTNFTEFNKFVYIFFDSSDRRGWDWVINENTTDNNEAMDMFFELLDKFIGDYSREN